MIHLNELAAADTDLIRDLIARSELQSIQFHEVSAKRFDGVLDETQSKDGQVSFSYQHRSNTDGFGIRITANVALSFGEINVTAAVDYKLLNGDIPAERLLEQFANEVAIMTLFPYVRESIATISTKVFGDPITLPVAHRGQLGFDLSKE